VRVLALLVRQLLAKVFEGDLNAVVIEFLVLGSELITATSATMKKLGDRRYRRMGRRLHPCCTSNIRKTVEILIDNIVE
jgi:hypothetical protein